MRFILTLLGLVLFCASGSAHHSTNVHFDGDDVVEIAGVLTEVQWQNPHVQLKVLAPDEDGNEVVWQVEEISINEQLRRGVTRDQYRVGEVIRVAGPRGLRNRTAIFAFNTLLADGRELAWAEPRWTTNLVMSRAGYRDAKIKSASTDSTDMFRVWSRNLEAGGRAMWNTSYPLTEQARMTQANWDRVADNPFIHCRNGMPAIMDSNEPVEFVLEGDDILIRLEEQDVVRRVHMGANPTNSAPNPYGHSVGRWEDETLVVTTTEIDFPWFDQAGIPQSEALKLEERFTVDKEDSRYLNYSVTATDPAVFTEPVVLEKRWLWIGEEIQPYNCTYERDDL